MVKDGTYEQKLSACGYFGYKCPPETAAPSMADLASVMRDTKKSSRVRGTAAWALCWFGKDAHKYYNDMLKVIAADESDDPFAALDETVGRSLNILCPDPYKAGLVTDKKLFYAAVGKLLDHKRQSARGSGMAMILNMPLEDFHIVADKVMHIVEDKDLTYHSYHNPMTAMGKGLIVLANLNIDGGIDAAFKIMNAEAGKWGFKVRMMMNVLPKYGANAKPALAKLKADPRWKNIEKGRFGGAWRAMVNAIESSTGTRKMISPDEAKNAGRKRKTENR
jgi:hypothetical protein